MKIWNIQEKFDTKIYPPEKIIDALLKNRGIVSKKEREAFFHPKNPNDFTPEEVRIHAPALKKILTRITKAIQEK